jgi:asparagine synthase (glutamine-hydrolysing)
MTRRIFPSYAQCSTAKVPPLSQVEPVMCGIAGFIQRDKSPDGWRDVLSSMANQLVHRGPDSSGIWFDAQAGVGLAHRRLSIIDLSPDGHQPMVSRSGRFVIVFNGEIYNFETLRADLIAYGHSFRGRSDTEVILASIEQWGIAAAVLRFTGMFAFALWDRSRRTLHLVRDRLGEKPLYFGNVGQAFAFASELKALRRHPEWEGKVNRDALTLFMARGNVPAPMSIYNGIRKQRPGSIISVEFSRQVPTLTEALYWSMDEVVDQGQRHIVRGSEDDMISNLEELLKSSIKQQMVADVPLGAFLSGGIDSSTVVAIMQSVSCRPIKTFSIGSTYNDFDEAGFAKAVADHLGTDHTELYVSADDALSVISRLPSVYDEPFADSSQIPTYLVAELARRHVSVSLSGDAGDELFCGYGRYFLTNDLWKTIAWLSPSMRRRIARSLLLAPTGYLDRGFSWLGPLFSRYGRAGRAGDKLKKAALLLGSKTPDEFYRLLISRCTDELVQHEEGKHESERDEDVQRSVPVVGLVQRMMYLDTIEYLPDDILVKVDRATMANSLESRIPLLDHRVVEYAWQLPLAVKYRNRQGKWILRQVLSKYVPKALIERPKMGFGIPIAAWLRGPLREWAEELLSEHRLRQEGYLNVALIREKWSEHLTGARNWQAALWSVLMFQAWLSEHGRAS